MEEGFKVRLYNELLDDLKKELAEAEAEVIKYHKLILKKEIYKRILNDEHYLLDKEYETFLSEVNDNIKESEKNFKNWELKKRMRENEIIVFKQMMIEEKLIDLESLPDEELKRYL